MYFTTAGLHWGVPCLPALWSYTVVRSSQPQVPTQTHSETEGISLQDTYLHVFQLAQGRATLI